MSGSQPSPVEAIGKYQIVDKIGEGGYAAVYKGYDPLIKRFVAIKSCLARDPETRERFRREAEIAGNLDHPNIVRIFDLGSDGETPYLVQEYLDGEDLDVKIDRREFLPFPEKLLYLIQIARGLAYAHSRGVIHRDVKPANIRILDDGTAKIMDFGIAKLMQFDSSLTRAGMTMGTAAYLAPEQIRGHEASPRTDIFSYGVLAYELLTGTRPFGGETISATFFQILNDEPRPVPLYCPDCPPALAELLATCLRKDPQRRFPDFGEILRRLEAVRSGLRAEGGSLAASLATRPIPVGPVRPAAAPPPLRPATPGAAGLDEIELDPPIRRPSSAIPLQRTRRSRLPLLMLLGLALLLTALAFRRLPDWPVGEALTLVTEPPARAAAQVAEAAPPPALPEAPVPEPEPPEPPGSDPAPPPPAEPAPAETPAAAPAPPALATLLLPPGWSDRIRVSIDGGPEFALDSARTRHLTPGSHSLTFSLLTPRYRAIETVRVVLEPGEERRLRIPISPPGALTVQADLGSPQGRVRVDGEELGSTPLRRHFLAAGLHRVSVYAPNRASSPVFERPLRVRPGEETVITFDLSGRREPLVRHRSARP